MAPLSLLFLFFFSFFFLFFRCRNYDKLIFGWTIYFNVLSILLSVRNKNARVLKDTECLSTAWVAFSALSLHHKDKIQDSTTKHCSTPKLKWIIDFISVFSPARLRDHFRWWSNSCSTISGWRQVTQAEGLLKSHFVQRFLFISWNDALISSWPELLFFHHYWGLTWVKIKTYLWKYNFLHYCNDNEVIDRLWKVIKRKLVFSNFV